MDDPAATDIPAPRASRAGLVVRAVLLLAVAVAGYVAVRRFGADPAAWFSRSGVCPPALFVAIVAFLPLAGFPLAPLYLYAGAAYGLAEGLPLTLAGIAANLAMAHPLYGRLLREPLEALLRRRGYRVPAFPERHRLKAAILVASVPALPYWAQNAVLALGRIPFPMFFAVSFGVHIVIAGVVIALASKTRAHLSSPWFFAALAVAGVVSGFLALRGRREKNDARKKPCSPARE